MKKPLIPILYLFLLAVCVLGAGASVTAQDVKKASAETKMHRGQSIALLDNIKEALKEHYYDPKYKGMNLETRFEAAKQRIKTLDYNWQMYRVIAQVLLELDDSHTSFHLPPRTDYFNYGFGVQMVGNDCFVVSVQKDSDAQKKGLAVGDKIVAINRFKPSREDLWKIFYVIYRLDPSKTVELKVEPLEGGPKTLTVEAKTMTQKERRAEIKKRKTKEKFEPVKCTEINPDLIACKLETFEVEKSAIDKMMKQVGTHKNFILDLRGNSGGYVMIEEYLLSHFFDRDTKIADVITRKKRETRMAKTRGDKTYKGQLVVLVDSDSASAAEMTARVIQLEKRGKVMGDVTSGAVMTSIEIPLFGDPSLFADYVVSSVSLSVSIADVIMSDGSRLEHTGVIPDVPVVPSGLALSKKLDPVLALAAGSLGAELTAEQAGAFHFITEKDDNDKDKDKGEDEK